MTLAFKPVWTSQPGTITTTVTEGITASIALGIEVVAGTMMPTGSDSIALGSYAADFSLLRVSGQTVPSSLINTTLRFAPLQAPARVEIVLVRAPNVSVLNGALPPGLTLTPFATILGTVGNIEPQPLGTVREFEFTARASINGHERDRTFIIRSGWNDSPPIWALLPAPPQENGRYRIAPPGLTFIRHGSPFAYTFRVTDADGLPPPARFINDDSPLPGLPPGLRYIPSERLIEGTVALDAPVRRYNFTLRLQGTDEPLPCFIEVAPRVGTGLRPPQVLAWRTPAGPIGELRDGDPCPFSVLARSSDVPPTYSLVPGLGDLPPGLSLDTSSGAIRGFVTGGSGIYGFAVRAVAEGAFADRTFSIRVEATYRDEAIATIGLRVPPSILGGYKAVLTARTLFRPEDPQFGRPQMPIIALLGGIGGSDDALLNAIGADPGGGMPAAGYHMAARVQLGQHRLLYVRDASGAVLYEVLFREVVDPLAGAGGFLASGVEDPIRNVHHPEVIVRTPSLTNIRADLARDLGFPTVNPRLSASLGLTGGEQLPPWFRSPQRLAELGTATGFIPGMVVAYLMPGVGEATLNAVRNAEGVSLPATGTVLDFASYVRLRIERPSGIVSVRDILLTTPRPGVP